MSTGPSSPHPLLETRGVAKVYPGGVEALRGVDLSVGEAETVVLIGESGCGKTTLMRLFNRLEEPTSGEVWSLGRPAREQEPILLRRHIGYVQQEGGLLPHWTVARNIELVPSLLDWSRERRRARAEELLDLVGLPASEYADRHPHALSGGQRQRVAFARAIAADPDVVLLDEPFGALDALTRAELQEHFLHLKEVLGKTFLVVTHDLEEAFRLGDRIAVMQAGRILQLASPDVLLAAPSDAYVESLLHYLTRGADARAPATK